MNVDKIETLEKVGDIVDGAKWSLVQFLQSQLGFPISPCVIVFSFAMTRSREVDDGLRTVWTKWGAG